MLQKVVVLGQLYLLRDVRPTVHTVLYSITDHLTFEMINHGSHHSEGLQQSGI